MEAEFRATYDVMPSSPLDMTRNHYRFKLFGYTTLSPHLWPTVVDLQPVVSASHAWTTSQAAEAEGP